VAPMPGSVGTTIHSLAAWHPYRGAKLPDWIAAVEDEGCRAQWVIQHRLKVQGEASLGAPCTNAYKER
jgi:hypothetical protein